MTQAERALPWLYVTLAATILALAVATGELPGGPWWIPVLAASVLAAVVGWRVHGVSPAFSACYVLASAKLAATELDAVGPAHDHLTWMRGLTDLTVGAALAVMLGAVLRRRNGSFGNRDILDVLCVLTGAGLASWVLAANPLVADQGVGFVTAMLTASYLPIALLLVTFVVDLAMTGVTPNRSIQFVLVGVVANLVASVMACLVLADVISATWGPIATAVYCGAFLLMGAGLTHRDVRRSLERRPETSLRLGSSNRLVPIAASFTAPALLIAVFGPTSTVDTVVRTIAAVILVAAVTARLWVALVDDVAARRRLERQLHRDELTNLPNRTRFVQEVAEILEATWRSERQPTIIKLNLDRFKNINDTLGHDDANRVLMTVAERLDAAAASFDGFVARSGGDDFVVIDASTTTPAEAMARADTIRDALRPPVVIGESTMFVTASIGVAQAPRNRTLTAEDFMRRADIAAHEAKASGRNRIVPFDDSMQANLSRRMDVEHALHGAIGRGEMRLYHQPIVDLLTGRVTGFEALMRWQRGDGTIVPPLDFIPIAEETGVIIELGAWALGDALGELQRWVDSGIVRPDTTMSVNVSPRQVADPAFADVVRGALDSSGIAPSRLWIEITESMMLDEPDTARRSLEQVRAMGVRIALDDFGTGYSSLSLLQQFPIQRIKIDRAFVNGVAEEGNDRSLVRTVIAMAHSMDLDLVAEGVETIDQLEALRQLGCDKAQGYLISRPVPSDAMRSTMSALHELAQLSLFAPEPPPPVRHTPEPTPARSHAPQLIGGPIGSSMSRPLGRPML